jgi:hypothetical protein
MLSDPEVYLSVRRTSFHIKMWEGFCVGQGAFEDLNVRGHIFYGVQGKA